MWPTGILRGQSGACPHRIARALHRTPPPLTQPSNPDFPEFTHSITVAASWDQVKNMIFDRHAQLSAVYPSTHKQCVHFQGNLQDTVEWMWHVCRSGIAVAIRNSKVELFVPFCNPNYTNTWSNQARALLPQTGRPAHQWWANGWLLCGDKVQKQLMSDHGFCAILNMLLVCCEGGNMSDCDFVINKRDSACVRLDGCDPLNPLDPYQEPMYRPALVPVLSQYVGDQFADIAMPLASDWHRLSCGTFHGQNPASPVAKPRAIPWEQKKDCAIFRGSMTGSGAHCDTHQRLALLHYHDGIHFDIKGTGTNQRLRYCPLEKKIVMPHCDGYDIGKHNFIALHHQQEQFQYSIVADGHSGVDRLAALCGGQQVVLKIDSPVHALCPDTWASQRLHAWEHYIPVDFRMSNMQSQLQWARANKAACLRILRNCAAWQRQERKKIITWWRETSAMMA